MTFPSVSLNFDADLKSRIDRTAVMEKVAAAIAEVYPDRVDIKISTVLLGKPNATVFSYDFVFTPEELAEYRKKVADALRSFEIMKGSTIWLIDKVIVRTDLNDEVKK